MTQQHDPERGRPNANWTRYLRFGLPVVAVALVAIWFLLPSGEAAQNGATFQARRGDLLIRVLEGGSVAARESQVIKSEVRGETKILSIVEEGYLVTADDVANEKVLVTLDDSQLEERLTQAEIEYQSATASYTDAREQYEIQIKQNESDIKSAELGVKFARMDFEKYLGEEVARGILKARNLEDPQTGRPLIAPEEAPDANESSEDDGGAVAMASVAGPPPPPVDFQEYADPERLGDGEAREQLLKLQSDLRLSEQELQLATNNLEGTQRLAEKDFVTQQELEADEMQVRKQRSAAEASSIAVDLFIKYEFPKQAEKLLSDYEEAIRKLERVRKEAVSKLAQAEARMKSTEAKYKLQKQQRDEYVEQLEKCVIVAERPGLVVYAGGNDRYRQQAPVEEGATVREHQEIITIPDMTEMAVDVKIHESAIKKVERGLRARVRLDAFPDRVLDGEIVKLSVLPDSGRRWMNPDLKLYPATVSIDGVHDWLKPGMSAEVEIVVTELQDVVFVPLQAVTTVNDERVVYVAKAVGDPERRVVETGEFNDEFIEIRSGLKEGERVLLRAPRLRQQPGGPSEQGPGEQAPPVADVARAAG